MTMVIPDNIKKYLIIGIVVLAIGGVVTSVAVVGNSLLSKATSPAPAPAPQIVRIPTPAPQNIASPAAVSAEIPVSETPPVINPSEPVTTNGWIITGSSLVTVAPQFASDKKSLIVDFQSNNYSQINNVEYSLTYTADPQIVQLIKNNFVPLSAATRKSIPLGTCSGTNCVYDANPRGFTLRVLVKSNNSLSINLVTLTYASSP